MRGHVLLAAFALIASAPAPPSPSFDPVAADEAIAFFRHMCVETVPEPRAFVAAFNAEQPGWAPYQRRGRGGAVVIGRAWRSSRGQLSYLNLPGPLFGETNPGCHYSFRTAANYSHDETAAALVRALSLPPGRETGTRREPQTRWEARLASGLRVRLFLSTAVRDMGVPAATLSISAYVQQPNGN